MNSLNNLFAQMRRSLNPTVQDDALRQPLFEGDPELVQNLYQVVFQMDLSGTWTFLNEAWTKFSGYSLNESIGSRYQNYIHPADRDRFREHFSRITQPSRENLPITGRLIRKDGAPCWVVLHANPVLDDNDEILCTVGTFTDITERIHEEELLHAKHRSLENLINSVPCMVYRCRNDKAWTMEYASGGSLALTGHQPDEMINNYKLSYRSLIHPDDQDRVWEEVQNCLRHNQPFELVYRIVTTQGVEKWVLNQGKGCFSFSGKLLCIEGYITDISQRRKNEERLQLASLYDADTGLPNPALFFDRLQRAIHKIESRNGHFFTLLLVSIDQYQDILGKYGTKHYDQVIAEVSGRLSEILRVTDSVSRLEDDRLAILLESIHNIKGLTTTMRRIQEQVQATIFVEQSEFYTTASIGVAMSNTGYKSGDDILLDANTALSRARALGGARYEIFDLRSHAKAAAQSQIESELKHALEQSELRVYWQPAIALKTGRLEGLEAKMVWPHPRRGILFADDFVPNAEETQLITPLWEWMLVEASHQMEAWPQRAGSENVAINIQISGKTLLDANSILRLGHQLLSTKPPPFTLAVGIPENVLTQTPRAIKIMLRRLKARNIRLFLTDFGTDTTSLLTLKSMPVDFVRLDRRLVAECGENDGKYVGAIASLARALGIRVVADGVETADQLSILKRLDIDHAQGNFISSPVGADAVTGLLDKIGRQWF